MSPDVFESNHAAFMAELDKDFSAELAYRAKIANERRKGEENIRRMMREWRRELWLEFPDPIDRENGRKMVAELKRLGEAATNARLAFERARYVIFENAAKLGKPFPLPVAPTYDDASATEWRIGQRIAMSITPMVLDAHALAVTSPA